MFGHFDQAIQTLTKASELCEAAGYAEETGIAYYLLVSAHMWRADYERVFELKEDLMRITEQSFHLRSYVRGLSLASQCYGQLGRWDEAVELGKKALSAAQEYSDNSLIALAESFLGAVYTFKRDMGQAIKYAELAVGRAPTPADKAIAEAFLSWPLCHAGEPHKGIELLLEIIPVVQAVRLVMLELWFTLFLADGYWLAGEYNNGRQTAEELLRIATRCGARYCIGYVLPTPRRDRPQNRTIESPVSLATRHRDLSRNKSRERTGPHLLGHGPFPCTAGECGAGT